MKKRTTRSKVENVAILFVIGGLILLAGIVLADGILTSGPADWFQP